MIYQTEVLFELPVSIILCVFPVRMCIPIELRPNTWWGWVFVVSQITTTGGKLLRGMHILTRIENMPHWELGFDLSGMHIF